MFADTLSWLSRTNASAGVSLRPGIVGCLDPFAAAALCVSFACCLLLFLVTMPSLGRTLVPSVALDDTVVAFVVVVLVIAFYFCHLATSLLILGFSSEVHYF